MKKVPYRSRTRSSNTLLSEKPLITVEKSFEISFDYSPADSSCNISQLGFERNSDRTQSTLMPSAMCRAEASIGRPSTARNKPTTSTDQDNPICPSPVVRVSQDKIDLHEALRSQLPPFRQSRRWAKAYMDRDESAKPSTPVVTPVSPPKRRHAFACDTSQQPHFTGHAAATSDDESEYSGLCRPAHVPGWQMLKKHRLLSRHSMPIKIVASVETRPLRQEKSIRSIRTRLNTSPRNALLPRVVRSNSRGRKDNQRKYSTTPSSWRKHRAQKISQNTLISALSENLENIIPDCSSSPVSSLHDYEKVKRFSQECVTMLSGLDFGDEWRASIVAPSLSLSMTQKSPVETAEPSTGLTVQSIGPVLDHSASMEIPQVTSMPSLQSLRVPTSGPTSGRLADPIQLFQAACTSMLDQNSASVNVNNVQSNCENRGLSEVGPVKPKSSISSFSGRVNEDLKNLKNARSIDTLTQIEAQVEDTPAPSVHQLERKPSTFTLSSPKKQKPSGEPPERPLPDLPKDEHGDGLSTIGRCSSVASSRRSRTIRETLELVGPYEMSSIQTMINIPLDQNGHFGATCVTDQCTMRSNIKAPDHLDFPERLSSLNLSSGLGYGQIPHGGESSLGQTPGDVSNQRRDRIQQMKKKHVAAWTKSHDDLYQVINQNRSANSTKLDVSCVDTDASTRQSVAEQLWFKNGASYGIDGGIVMSNTGGPATHVGTHSLAIPCPTPGGQSVVTASETSSQKLARTVSKVKAPSRLNPNRHGMLKHTVSTPNLRNTSMKVNRPKQALGCSQIMVVVDTNPHTSSFRAGASSPSPSMMLSGSRPNSPACHQAVGKPSKSPQKIRAFHEYTSSAELDTLAELIDIVKPPPSVQRKRSSQSLRLRQTCVRSGTSNSARNAAECASPTINTFRSRSKANCQRVLDSSDSELEDSPLLKQGQTVASSRNISRASLRRSHHKRMDTPLTTVLKEEVRKADLELENLKKYEQRIEYLQLHLEQTLKVWSRMSQNGKKQYLASTFGGVDGKSPIKGRADNSFDVLSIAASSIYSKRSSIQRLDESVSKSLKDALDRTRNDPNDMRRISGSSTPTRTGTDTDTDTSADVVNGSLGKRASGGSLTDPQDYDILESTRYSPPSATSKDSQGLKMKAESLGTNLDDLRARLQATRRPIIPVRRRKLQQSSSRTVSPTTTNTESKATTASPANRLAVAPWEELEHEKGTQKQTPVLSSNTVNEDGRVDRLSLDQETLRTDQMDAMLIW